VTCTGRRGCLVCQIQGMRVLGKTGVAEAYMVAVVEHALRILD